MPEISAMVEQRAGIDPQALRADFEAVATSGVDYLAIEDISWNDSGMDLELIGRLFESIPAFRTINIAAVTIN